ncbi:hypothetical protein LIER_34838 [Lithospermum erythrorhizon]|uniref:Uncharacterized protein n=1 Tax=Lithospermum erythrorhizon TaxID=34254 RepID=A0AAV3S3F0_LITER
MCTNFTSLNKACPKDFYPLPCLGRLVDVSAGHEVFDFMDASRGYHQIGRNMEIYVDDMLVKSKEKGHHLENLRETFEQLRFSRLRINPEKCSFEVTSGKFLGYKISESGIEPNSNKIKALLNMEPPRSYKDVQNEGSRAGLLIYGPKWVEMAYSIRFNIEATNNEAEYKALVEGMELVQSLGVQQILVRGD